MISDLDQQPTLTIIYDCTVCIQFGLYTKVTAISAKEEKLQKIMQNCLRLVGLAVGDRGIGIERWKRKQALTLLILVKEVRLLRNRS
ncbi:MAG: hypothetical protein CL392_10850 [Acidiferrobacteraceae bacterium]|nr:hypothetical protein [Acidiferrobacteraceae bacterium]